MKTVKKQTNRKYNKINNKQQRMKLKIKNSQLIMMIRFHKNFMTQI